MINYKRIKEAIEFSSTENSMAFVFLLIRIDCTVLTS